MGRIRDLVAKVWAWGIRREGKESTREVPPETAPKGGSEGEEVSSPAPQSPVRGVLEGPAGARREGGAEETLPGSLTAPEEGPSARSDVQVLTVVLDP